MHWSPSARAKSCIVANLFVKSYFAPRKKQLLEPMWFAPLMLPEDVDIISSDDENILLMLPSNERKEFRKALRKEIRERDDSETESESTERESENYPDYISQSEEDTDSESECDEESEYDSEEEYEEETEEES